MNWEKFLTSISIEEARQLRAVLEKNPNTSPDYGNLHRDTPLHQLPKLNSAEKALAKNLAQKIRAIKEYRQRTGSSLIAAKNKVEEYQRNPELSDMAQLINDAGDDKKKLATKLVNALTYAERLPAEVFDCRETQQDRQKVREMMTESDKEKHERYENLINFVAELLKE